MKKIIQQIRAADTWRKRVKLAENKEPGTAWDHVFRQADFAFLINNRYGHKDARPYFALLGKGLAIMIQQGDSQGIHDMADALAVWKRHKPDPEPVLVVLFGLTGSFPPGWTKRRVIRDPKTGHIIRLGLPPGTPEKITMRDIKRNLQRLYYPNMSDDRWNTLRRKAQRYAKEFQIELDSTPGRPTRKLRQDRNTKAR